MPATAEMRDALFVPDGGELRLRGARCSACDTHVFPTQAACPRGGGVTADIGLPSTGTVWSVTVQRLAPKAPYAAGGEFEPFAVAYVDLGPVRVESPLAGRPPEGWQIGDAVSLVTGARPSHPGWHFWFEAPAP